MDESSKIVSHDLADDVATPGHRLDRQSFPRKHCSPQTLRARRGCGHELFHVWIAADHSIESHDVRRRYLGRERQEIATKKPHPIRVATLRGFIGRGVDVGRCGIDVYRGVSSFVEQLVMYDADSTTDVEQGRAPHARRFQLIEQEPGCFVWPILAITP